MPNVSDQEEGKQEAKADDEIVASVEPTEQPIPVVVGSL
jgi:hypothetical protein